MQTVRKINKRFWQHAAVSAGIAVIPFTLGTAVLLAPEAAHADVQTYSTSQRVYKVGLLLLDSTTDNSNAAQAAKGPENPDPFIFYIADQRSDVKPSGWVLENPLAPRTVTTDIYQRWLARDSSKPYSVGQNVTKDMAAYWEVSLSKTSEAELLQYDLLFITNHRFTSFSPADREKLRKLVDAGGVVWMDDCGNMRIDPNGRFFLDELQFRGDRPNNGAGPAIVQPAHPLLTSPYTLSYDDILRLGDKGYGNYFMASLLPGAAGVNDIALTAPNKETLTTIIGNTAERDTVTGQGFLPYVSAGVYGSGAVILSSADVGCGINDYAGGTPPGNSGAYCGPNLLSANIEDLKILYNGIAWGGANNTVRRNNRRTASSFSATAAPLNPLFDFTSTGDGVNSSSSPLISQGIMYVAGVGAGGNISLRAYDTIPNRDYDNDGNFDDGRPDLINGTPYDEIWRWDGPAGGGGQPSSPVLATLNVNGQPVDVILLTGADGTVYAFNARPLTANGTLSPTPALLGTNAPTNTGTYTGTTGRVAPAPVFFANKIYAVEPVSGIIRCIDASTFTTSWTSSPPVQANQNYIATGTPTMGLNRLVVNKTRDTNTTSRENTIAGNTNETTNDVMLYVPVADGTAVPLASKLLPYWVGTRNEGTKDLNLDNGASYMRLRPASTNRDQYFVSKGGSGFITPTVQLYADVDLPDGRHFSREENFAAGRPLFPLAQFWRDNNYNPIWQVNWVDSATNATYYDGRLEIRHDGIAANPATDRLLAVASYDLVYTPRTGTAPQYLTQNPGHRSANALTIPASFDPNAASALRGIENAAFAPNDLLIYAANQANPNDTNIQFGAVNALQEREFSASASRLRWRYLLHEGATTTVGNAAINDLPALRNRMLFRTAGTGVDPEKPLENAFLTTQAPFYEALTQARVVGSPITTNDGVTYVLARATSAGNASNDPGNTNGDMTVVMAFQTAPQITLELGEPIQNNTTVTLSQYDPITGNTVSTNGDPNDRTRVDVDYRTGRITVADFGANNNGNNLMSASSSFVVTYTKASGNSTGALAPTTKVLTPFGSIPQVANAGEVGNVLQGATGAAVGGYSPLLWYYVLPGVPQSSPTKIGDQLFLSVTIAGRNRILALDADPASNDSTVRVRSGEQVYNVAARVQGQEVARNHVRWNREINGVGTGSPSGGEGVLAINTTPASGATPAPGTNAFSEGLTLIADNTRIMEVDANGAAVWSATGTSEVRTVGGAAPVYDQNGDLVSPTNSKGRQVLNPKSFSSPQTVRRLGSTDYLAADTGNNRVVRFDRSGNTKWTLERMNDPLGVLAPGDPLTLNNPTDVLTRRLATFDAANNRIGYEDHYIIADSGNSRIIDVVDYYDLNGNPRTFNIGGAGQTDHVVVWTSRTKSKEGSLFNYHNLQLTAEADNTVGAYGKPVLVASISNATVAAANNTNSVNGSGGSVVRMDYNPKNTGFVLTDIGTGAPSVKYYWGGGADGGGTPVAGVAEPATNGQVQLAINELRFLNGGTATTQRLRDPSYFEQIPLNLNGTGLTSVYLIADAAGVYMCRVNTVNGNTVFDVIWAFGQTQYNEMNVDPDKPRLYNPNPLNVNALPPFRPTAIKRLANGNMLITNSATGPSQLFVTGQFLGEAFEVQPKAFNLGGTGNVATTAFGGTFKDFSVPSIVMPRDPNGATPRAANKQQMGIDRNGATLTEQPHSANRL